jgi:hypothetical protein
MRRNRRHEQNRQLALPPQPRQMQTQQRHVHPGGGWIDPDRSFPDPWSFSAHHPDPVGNGGSNNGPLVSTHLVCNQRAGNRPPKSETVHGRQW